MVQAGLVEAGRSDFRGGTVVLESGECAGARWLAGIKPASIEVSQHPKVPGTS